MQKLLDKAQQEEQQQGRKVHARNGRNQLAKRLQYRVGGIANGLPGLAIPIDGREKGEDAPKNNQPDKQVNKANQDSDELNHGFNASSLEFVCR